MSSWESRPHHQHQAAPNNPSKLLQPSNTSIQHHPATSSHLTDYDESPKSKVNMQEVTGYSQASAFLMKPKLLEDVQQHMSSIHLMRNVHSTLVNGPISAPVHAPISALNRGQMPPSPQNTPVPQNLPKAQNPQKLPNTSNTANMQNLPNDKDATSPVNLLNDSSYCNDLRRVADQCRQLQSSPNLRQFMPDKRPKDRPLSRPSNGNETVKTPSNMLRLPTGAFKNSFEQFEREWLQTKTANISSSLDCNSLPSA